MSRHCFIAIHSLLQLIFRSHFSLSPSLLSRTIPEHVRRIPPALRPFAASFRRRDECTRSFRPAQIIWQKTSARRASRVFYYTFSIYSSARRILFSLSPSTSSFSSVWFSGRFSCAFHFCSQSSCRNFLKRTSFANDDADDVKIVDVASIGRNDASANTIDAELGDSPNVSQPDGDAHTAADRRAFAETPNDTEAATSSQRTRQSKFLKFPIDFDTREFKTGYQLNPNIVKRFNAFVSFGKSCESSTSCHCAGGCDSAETIMGAPIASSSSASSSASAVSASSSSFSASSASSSSSSSAFPPPPLSNPLGSSPSASIFSAEGNKTSSLSFHRPAISASDNHLPTNEQFYPLAASEMQTSDDIDRNQQHGDHHQHAHRHTDRNAHANQSQKKTWSRIVNAPAQAMQKMRKMHADATGLGAFYGSDHFTAKNKHRNP